MSVWLSVHEGTLRWHLQFFYPQVSLSNSADLEEIKKEKAEKKEKFGTWKIVWNAKAVIVMIQWLSACLNGIFTSRLKLEQRH